jgi:hypothetical protein
MWSINFIAFKKFSRKRENEYVTWKRDGKDKMFIVYNVKYVKGEL